MTAAMRAEVVRRLARRLAPGARDLAGADEALERSLESACCAP